MSTCSRTFTGSVLGTDPNPPDVGAPDTPSILTPLSVTFDSFLARWSAAATGAAATGFKLDVATDLGYNSFVPGFNDLDVGLVTSQSVTGLAQNTGYFYRVRAYNGSGTSQSTGSVFVQTGTESVIVGETVGSYLLKKSEKDSLYANDNSAFLTVPYTIEAWIKRSSDNVGYEFALIFSKYKYGLYGGYAFGLDEYNALSLSHIGKFELYNGPAESRVLVSDGWTHVAVRVTGKYGTVDFFKNGVRVSTNQASNPGPGLIPSGTSAPQRVGAGTTQSGASIFPFDGNITEVRFWNTSRSNSQIASNYQTRMTGNEAGLVAYWPLVNTTNDQSSSGLYSLANQGATLSTDGPALT